MMPPRPFQGLPPKGGSRSGPAKPDPRTPLDGRRRFARLWRDQPDRALRILTPAGLYPDRALTDATAVQSSTSRCARSFS